MSGFYTLKGYQLSEEADFTPAMEDYLEMIYRLVQKNGRVKIKDISSFLNVRPPSSSKMVYKLNELGYVVAKRYGEILLTEKGKEAGAYLLYRHNIIHSFLCLLNRSDNQLEETEKIEHFISKNTVMNLDRLINLYLKNKDF